jgi:hypothetical protein
MDLSMLGKLGSRLRRDAGIGVERTYLYKRHALDAMPADVPTDANVRIERIPLQQLDAIAALGSADPGEWRQRLDRGDCCYGAWVGSELAHYSWVQTSGRHPIMTAGVEPTIRIGELWIYNCRTADAHRGKRLYPCTLQRIVRDYFATGAVEAWIYTSADNVPSQRGVVRAGFVKHQTLRALRFGRRYRRLVDEITTATPVFRRA